MLWPSNTSSKEMKIKTFPPQICNFWEIAQGLPSFLIEVWVIISRRKEEGPMTPFSEAVDNQPPLKMALACAHM
jgi:hypothetical protein